MYKLEYLDIAKKDMDDIVCCISNNLNNNRAALNLANNFIKEANNILQFPYGEKEYEPIKKLTNKYRKSRVNNYIIFYTINENIKTVTIVRVLHYKRNIDKILFKI